MLHNPLTLHASPRSPTVLELLAAERLTPQLREALQYTLAVIAARHPVLLRLHARADEAWALGMLLLESHFLHTSDSSFAESFYGVRRARFEQDGRSTRLTPAQRRLSLVALVVLPYLRTKLMALRAGALGRQRTAMLLHASAREIPPPREHPPPAVSGSGGDAGSGGNPGSEEDAQRPCLAAARRLARQLSLTHPGSDTPGFLLLLNKSARVFKSVKSGAVRALVAVAPFVDAATEAERLGWQAAHAFGATRQWSTLLKFGGMELIRRTAGDELSRASAEGGGAMVGGALSALLAQARDVRKLLRAGPSRHAGALSHALARLLRLLSAVVLEHARHGLVILVIVIKILHWWYSPEAGATRPRVFPLPPPPPLLPASDGVRLPAEKGVCPLCRMPRVNATLAPSGYVFCYRCIFSALEREGRCPLTLMPAAVDSLRKIYEPDS
ncbi:Pex12 amino terminal region-domain-containing protein [Pavlovales sp. CCMP2436]|nr:Pex12 amino terminal region-domain-containing protein [Pavlovales sp. CCMP2436]|mmetsp:Transcript_43406/g.107278  ORF Transcript_43406/g.107278 Transcript_43406/m.107278 type:complete len:443 (+) Transcript_43406:163-1491(+)